MRNVVRVIFLVAVSLLSENALVAQQTAEVFQGEVVEQFLLKARMTALRGIPQGVTKPRRATLELDGVAHFAVFKTIDESKPYEPREHGVEVDFQDSWHTEVAAYEVDKIIGLEMVPATVERELDGRRGSLQFWVESIMPEAERVAKKINVPDVEAWNQAMFRVRLFDNLIYNVDRNLTNILVTKDFQLRLIDHSRSFRPFDTLKQASDLTRFSRSLLEGIQRLEEKDLTARVGRHLTIYQIRGMLKRRDAILALARGMVAQRGESVVLYP
jgi:hypothetical protein